MNALTPKVFLTIALILVGFAYYLQLQLPYSEDVGYLIHIAQQILRGGTYGKDFFETNPPLIMYLYSPACLFANFINLDPFSVVRAYTFLLAFFSISISYYLLKKVIEPQDKLYLYLITLMLIYVLLIQPIKMVGQREHFLMILVLPYLFLSVLELNNLKLNNIAAFLIGVMAGLGLAIKPFFLLPCVFVEMHLLITKRNFLAWIRPAILGIVLTIICYLIFIWYQQPNYFTVMLPLIRQFYFVGIKDPWSFILFHRINIFCFFTLFLFLILPKGRYPQIANILAIATFSMILAYFIPRAAWYYHMLPALGFACLLLTYTAITNLLYLKKTKAYRSKFIFISCLSIFLIPFITVPVNAVYKLSSYFIQDKKIGPINSLANYIASFPGKKSILCFSGNTTADCFYTTYLTNADYGTRFPFQWWLRGALKLEHYPEKIPLPSTLENNKNFLIENLVDDLNIQKPNFIIINTRDTNFSVARGFNYITYFSENPKFKAAWQHYQFLKNINYYQVYMRTG